MSTTEVPSSLPGNVSLADHDPEMFDLIEKEKVRFNVESQEQGKWKMQPHGIVGWCVVACWSWTSADERASSYLAQVVQYFSGVGFVSLVFPARNMLPKM